MCVRTLGGAQEGTGVAVMSAFVEIVFDNSDTRIPIDKDEVVLRRTVGLKKDEYFLDKKHVSKQDVMNLLESAGFSRSNPYYIVQQGKINSLAVAKDTERLQLLKEVAGTSVYDERREESVRIIEETALRRQKIEEVLKYIDDRLRELEEEKEELREYQVLDKEHRALEYIIFDTQLRETRTKLEEIEQQRQETSERVAEMYRQREQTASNVHALEKELRAIEAELQRFGDERNQLDVERQELTKRRTQLELDAKDAEDGGRERRKREAQLKQELERLNAEIAEKTQQLEQIRPQYEAAVRDEELAQQVRCAWPLAAEPGDAEAAQALNRAAPARCRRDSSAHAQRLEECEQERQAILNKQMRAARFSSVAERDAWLRGEIDNVTKALREKKKQVRVRGARARAHICVRQRTRTRMQMKLLSNELATAGKKLDQIRSDTQERTRGLEERKAIVAESTAKLAELRKQQGEYSAARKYVEAPQG